MSEESDDLSHPAKHRAWVLLGYDEVDIEPWVFSYQTLNIKMLIVEHNITQSYIQQML